jgi:hypothetical protein
MSLSLARKRAMFPSCNIQTVNLTQRLGALHGGRRQQQHFSRQVSRDTRALHKRLRMLATLSLPTALCRGLLAKWGSEARLAWLSPWLGSIRLAASTTDAFVS